MFGLGELKEVQVIQPKQLENSKIVKKHTALLNFANNVSNLVTGIGITALMAPIPERYQPLIQLVIFASLIYSSVYGNNEAKTILKESEKKSYFDRINDLDDVVVKFSKNEFDKLRDMF
jgi:hypothetical protein